MDQPDLILVPLDFAELAAGTLRSPAHPLYAQRHRVVLEVPADLLPPLATPARHLLADLRDLGYRVALTGARATSPRARTAPAFECDFERAA